MNKKVIAEVKRAKKLTKRLNEKILHEFVVRDTFTFWFELLVANRKVAREFYDKTNIITRDRIFKAVEEKALAKELK